MKNILILTLFCFIISLSTISLAENNIQKPNTNTSQQNTLYNKSSKNVDPHKLPMINIVNNRIECESLLAKMKKDVLAQLDQKLENNPNDLWSILIKGWAMNSEGKYDEAIKYFNKALKIKKVSGAYMGLGMAYINKGELEKANAYYMKALEQNESNDTYYIDNSNLPTPSLKVKDKNIGEVQDKTFNKLDKQLNKIHNKAVKEGSDVLIEGNSEPSQTPVNKQ